MSDTGERPGGELPPTRMTDLPEAERPVLAALAIVGRASLSAGELQELAEVDDLAPLIEDLERRGLIEREEKRRYRAAERVGEEIRKTDDALSTGERLLQNVTTLAKGGRLTPERLLEDAEAILGLSEWAAEMRRWERLLELVKTVQAGFEIAHRVEELLALLERGRDAARALGDWRSEVWALQRLATASASVGDSSAAQRHLREADRLISTKCQPATRRGRGPRRKPKPKPKSESESGSKLESGWESGLGSESGSGSGSERGPGPRPLTMRMLCSIAAVAVVAGGAAGYAIGESASNANAGQTIRHIVLTTVVRGHTVTARKTVTLPIRTVTRTVTVPPATVDTGLRESTTGPAAGLSTSAEGATGAAGGAGSGETGSTSGERATGSGGAPIE